MRGRRLRIAAAALIGGLLVVRIALPFALEWAVPRLAADQNLVARVGNIDLGLIAGEATLEDVTVDLPESGAVGAGPAGDGRRDDPLLSVERLHVAFEWTALLVGRIHLSAVEIGAPTIHVVQLADGRLRLPEPPPAGSEEADDLELETDDAEAGAGWTFALDRFELRRPELTLRTEAEQAAVVRLAAEQLGFDGLAIDAEGIAVGGIDLARPGIFVEREWLLAQGDTPTSDAAEPAPPPSAAPDAEPAPPPSAGPGAALPTLELEHLKIDRAEFTVNTETGPVDVALRFDVSDAGTRPGQTFPIDLGLEIDAAEIELEGRVGLDPIGFAGDLTWRRLTLPPFLQLAVPELAAWVASCETEGELAIEFRSTDAAEPAGIRLQGRTRVADLDFREPERGELALGWESLEIGIRQVFAPLAPDPERPVRVEIERVELVAPSIVHTNPPDALDALLATLGDEADPDAPSRDDEGEPAEPSDADRAAPPIVEVDEVRLSKGRLRYVDRSVEPTHTTAIDALRVAVDGVSTDPAPGAEEVLVEGSIQTTGRFALRGGLPGGRGDLEFELEALDLASYDALARGAGWRIDRGRTSLDSTIAATGEAVETQNRIVLHDLRVGTLAGNDFASRFGMSVDVALALLRDPAGDIALSAPITVDADGTGVDLAPVVASALRTALKGALTSPIKMLGVVTPKGGGEAAPAIPFASGAEAPAPDTREQLRALAELADQRPALAFRLVGHWADDDREPTARRMLREAAVAGDDLPDLEEVGFFERRRIGAALRERAGGGTAELSPEDEAILDRYVAATDVPETRLRALAEARAQSIRQSLLERGTPPAAITLASPRRADRAGVSIGFAARADDPAPAPVSSPGPDQQSSR